MKNVAKPVAATVTIAVAAMLALGAAPAFAATYASISGEASGNNISGRAAASLLRDDWAAAITARGGTVPTPVPIAGPNGTEVSGVIGTSSNGTTVSVQRTMYTPDPSPVYVGASANQGTAQCTGGGTTLQDSSPRPSIFQGNSGCTNGNGFSYGESGGPSPENLYRDAVEFTFSGVGALAFGAWFGDLETRTDGSGVPALLRLYGAGNVLLSEENIGPPATDPQVSCGSGFAGCGNSSTRWVGFTTDTTTPVTRMVVIVGDDDATGTAVNEGMSFVGTSILAGTTGITIAKTFTPMPAGPAEVGDSILYDFTITNTGQFPLSQVVINDGGAQDISCPDTLTTGSMACTGKHLLTQDDIDIGSFANTATVTGVAWGESITSAASVATTALNQAPSFTVAKTAHSTSFTSLGAPLAFTISVTNTGNTTLNAVSVSDTLSGVSLDCAAMPATLARNASGQCTASMVATALGEDIVNVATVTANGLTVVSPAATARYVGPSLARTGSDPVGASLAGTLLILAGLGLLAANRVTRPRSPRAQRP